MLAAPCGEIWSLVRVGSSEDVAGKIDVTMVSSAAPSAARPGHFCREGGRKGDLPGVVRWPLEAFSALQLPLLPPPTLVLVARSTKGSGDCRIFALC